MGEQEQVVEMVGAQDELEAKECEAEPQERDEARLEAAQPQATLEEQLARLGYRQAQAVVQSPPQDEELEPLGRREEVSR